MRTFSDRARSQPRPSSASPRPSSHRHTSRARQLLQWLREHITFQRLIFIAISIPLLIYLFSEATRHVVVLDPIVVPRQFSDAGFTSEVMTQRVREKIEEIQRANEFVSRREELSSPGDRGLPNIEIPETKLSLQVVSDVLRKLLGNEPRHLSGEITSSDTPGKLEIRCRILQSGALVQAGNPRRIDATVGDNTIEILARELTRLTDPYLLGIYLEEEKKDYTDASNVANQMLSSASSADHMYEKAHLLRGFIASATNHSEEAIADDRKAINLDPQWAYAHHCLAFVFDQQGKFDESAQEYRQAIRMNEASIPWWSTRSNPDFTASHVNLGWVLEEQHKLDEAVSEYRRAIQIDPKSAYAHYLLGGGLEGQNKLDEAVAEYRTAIRLDPRYSNPHAGLASVSIEKYKLDDAMAELQRALQLDPDLPFTHYLLGLALRNQYKSDEALQEFKTALQLYPRYAEAHVGIGQLMHSRGDPDEPIAAEYRTAMQISPGSALPHLSMGNLLRDQEKYDDAIAEYRTAIQLDPNYALPHNQLGEVLLVYQNKPDQAMASHSVLS
ncbi:MAG TPA: tetratricopeptide repeat protein [Edaphobacter sp.]|jgi:tetratricopeptide (TPR) repeat protein|nr:tetratricopeptide repeat protein [Edaphobacter sp.]